ncbi:paeninodin family lasso peptide [Virgibacillus sp. C22-A2]|uniref:Paeninodin family lasso peptide n=1 Tax=Virgibacillus tibetensis TaxID=3042313 RepID=A0ABU6KFF6_9BACI|nr:paeninodin family lasso peptide [Virgibacillus sp. C22-A2]
MGILKKEWIKPVLEVLDVHHTMLGSEGEYTDASFDAGTPFSEITVS